LPYQNLFDLGPTLSDAAGAVPLNHPHCAKFCVLGGPAYTRGYEGLLVPYRLHADIQNQFFLPD